MTAGRRLVGAARLAASTAVLIAGEAVLWRAGRTLPALPLEPERLVQAFVDAEPLALTMSVLRLAALAVGLALVVVTLVGGVARACGMVRLVAGVDRWTPTGLRHLLDGALGVGLAASIGLGALPAVAEPPVGPAGPATTAGGSAARPAPVLRRLADAPPPGTKQNDPTTTLRRLPDEAVPSAAPSSATPAFSAPVASGPFPSAAVSGDQASTGGSATSPSAPARREVVVAPGDSFWRLAEHHEAERLGRRPSEFEVGACWQELVALNRHRLVVPDDPDLIFPGQVMQMPCR